MKDEQQYNDFVREQVKNSEDLYFSDIEQNRDDTWGRIETQLKKKKVIPLWFYSAAASIILLIGLSFVFNQKLMNRNFEIARLKAELKAKEAELATVDEVSYKVVKMIDTVKIINKKIVYLPVKSYEKVIVHDTVTNLVKVVDTVYIKKNEVARFVSNEKTKTIENQEIITKSESSKKKKNKRFVFLFGRPKNDSYQSETERLITLKTK